MTLGLCAEGSVFSRRENTEQIQENNKSADRGSIRMLFEGFCVCNEHSIASGRLTILLFTQKYHKEDFFIFFLSPFYILFTPVRVLATPGGSYRCLTLCQKYEAILHLPLDKSV